MMRSFPAGANILIKINGHTSPTAGAGDIECKICIPLTSSNKLPSGRRPRRLRGAGEAIQLS